MNGFVNERMSGTYDTDDDGDIEADHNTDFVFDQETIDGSLSQDAEKEVEYEIMTTTAIPTYEELLDQARSICGQNKPPFALERRGTENGALKEVVLVGPDGKKPNLALSVPREVLTARGWDERYYLWVLDRGTEQFIMKCSGGVYRRCIGINGNRKAIYEGRHFAYPVPEARLPRPSSTPAVPDSDPVRSQPEHFMNQSPFRPRNAERPSTSRKRRLSYDHNDVSNAEASVAATSAVPNPLVVEVIERDRAYYSKKGVLPPYVHKTKSESFVAVLADEDERRTAFEIEVDTRPWNNVSQYLVVNIHGQEQIANRVSGGKGGWLLRLWPGRKDYEQGRKGKLIGYPQLSTKEEPSQQRSTRLPAGKSVPLRPRKLPRRSEPSSQHHAEPSARATSVPAVRRTTRKSEPSRLRQESAQVDGKAGTTKSQSRKDTGTPGYHASTAASKTPSNTVTGARKNTGTPAKHTPPVANTTPSGIITGARKNTGISSDEASPVVGQMLSGTITETLDDIEVASLASESPNDALPPPNVPNKAGMSPEELIVSLKPVTLIETKSDSRQRRKRDIQRQLLQLVRPFIPGGTSLLTGILCRT
ncbi:MAG: hypothetical protein Q9168_000161 [Polycauliona sp. 1 TL-2023]